MPQYEYICKGCKEKTTFIKKFSEMNREEICEKCLEPMERILYSGCNFSSYIKGFHKNDYKGSK